MDILGQTASQTLNLMWPLAAFVALLYFFVQRPQAKAKKKHETLLSNLKRGTKIVTYGGIYGTVTAVKKESVMLNVAEKVEIEVSREAIAKYQDEERNR